MITIRKEFNLCFSHLLEEHKGLCKNLHGHNYKLILTIKHNSGFYIRNSKSSFGMIIDYKDLKEFVNQHIIESMDHAFVYNKKDTVSNEIAEYLKKKINQKVYPVSFRVTAEQLVEYIAKEFNKKVDGQYPIECIKAELWETETSSAIYSENDN